jgi:hypothetical protein
VDDNVPKGCLKAGDQYMGLLHRPATNGKARVGLVHQVYSYICHPSALLPETNRRKETNLQ